MTDNQPKSLGLILTDSDDARMLLEAHDKYIKSLEGDAHVMINSRDEVTQLVGELSEIELVAFVSRALRTLIQRDIKVHTPDVVSVLKMAKAGNLGAFITMYEEEIMKDRHSRAIQIKNVGQREYTGAVKTHDVTFGAGPAGTGKTFLAVVMAVVALKKGGAQKIILIRPAVEAGESLGLLPGDLKEEVDPYLRPVYDALYQIFGMDYANRLVERGVIEIVPLAYMCGRTLDGIFVVLGETQNTTVAQMKMFLTRLGFNSEMIVSGDASQIDLPHGVISGLVNAKRTLKDIEKIVFIDFEANDVVRHPVVAQIVQAYGKEQQKHS